MSQILPKTSANDPTMMPATANTKIDRYVRNIVSAYRAATPEQLARGQQWYPVAQDLARVLGDGNVRRGAGVIAALSPMREWSRNVELAERAFAEGKASGHFGDAIRKAERILAGEDPSDVLPEHAKTGHFFRNIIDPTDPDPVTIDRHAHDVAVGEVYGGRDRGLSSKKRYAELAHAYRIAARELGVLPNVCQAVTWCRQVDQLEGK